MIARIDFVLVILLFVSLRGSRSEFFAEIISELLLNNFKIISQQFQNYYSIISELLLNNLFSRRDFPDVQSQAEVGNAGVKVVLTHRALNYAAEQAVEVLARKVPQSQINDLRGSANVAIGNVEYEITDTKVSSWI